MSHDFDIRRDAPLVSVTTTTYNHAPYIRQCMDGILAQQTDFPFELIVHDDASTDGTADIVREYADKYPHVIVPILQTENQHSKGIKISASLVLPLVRGRYQAICEGDDYWIDPLKLQKQFAYLEANPQKSMVHSAYVLQNDVTGQSSEKHTLIDHDAADVHWRIIGQDLMVCTCSVMCRTDFWREIRDKHAEDFDGYMMGDTQTWFHFARLHGIGYLDEVLCVYRKNAGGVTGMGSSLKRIAFLENARKLDLHLAEKYNAPRYWVDRIRNVFNASLFLEAVAAKDDARTLQYAAECVHDNRLFVALVRCLLMLNIRSRRVMGKMLAIYKRIMTFGSVDAKDGAPVA
jgi:glycosyltransferase involved in cell wall biosynthesis